MFARQKISLIVVVFAVIFFSNTLQAQRYWPPKLISWSMHLNNGVAYIISPQFPEHCSYSRGQINMDGTEFNKAQYAYALSAKARGKKLLYVTDSNQSICIITGLRETD